MTKKLKRILAILLTLSMVMSMVSMTSLALEEEADTVTLTYNANAGTDEVSVPDAQKVEPSTEVTIGSCGTRAGYNALGWSTDPDAKTADSTFAPDKTYVLDSDVTLYAVWKVAPEEEGDGTVKAGSYAELTKAISDAGTTPTTIKLTQSFDLANYLFINQEQNITLTAEDDVILSRSDSAKGSLWVKGNLTLENIVLDGASIPSPYAMVHVTKTGNVTMNA
ncbi:MAG: InlB B-repeat-containing protein, partial [Oscillospiraceae bacterium]|nr:InlB B-repeat-containing protein [Oscillospiraceae bacterium]